MNSRNSNRQQLCSISVLLPLWCALVASAQSTVTNPGGPSGSTVTYKDAAGRQHIYYFMMGNYSGGSLVVNYSPDSSNWNWANLAVPPGEVAVLNPSAITLFDNIWLNKQLVYAFVTGASTGHLYYIFGDESSLPSWTWCDLGMPNGTSVSKPSAVTYVDAHGKWRIYVFVTGADGTLWLSSYVYGQGWKWNSLGKPPGQSSFVGTSATTLFDNVWDHTQYVGAFGVAGQDLWSVFGEPELNNTWTWHNQGHPDGVYVGEPSAVTYVDANGHFRFYVFVSGLDSGNSSISSFSLFSNQYIYGYGWSWLNHGKAPGMQGELSPSAVADLSSDGKDLVYAFVNGEAYPYHLNVNYWDANSHTWQWATQADWPGGTVSIFGPPSATTWVDNSGVRHFYIFSPGGLFDPNDPSLALTYWNGSTWALRNQGKAPVERALIVANVASTPDPHNNFQKITSLTFGATTVGSSGGQFVLVRNTGTAPVTISNIATTSEFGVINQCPVSPATLGPGSFCLMQITFTPSAPGPRSGALLIPNDANEPWANQQGLSLYGTGQ